MSTDRNEITEALSKLSPKERRAAEDLVLEKILRDANARDEARDPEGYRIVREHAETVAAAIGPLSREGEAALRAAMADVARAMLAGED
jgi:hypothetical protein